MKAMSHGPTRLIYLGGLGLAIVVLVIAFSMMRPSRPADSAGTMVEAAPVPVAVGAANAQPMNTDAYDQLTAQSNAQAVAEAKASGGTAMPIPTVGEAEPKPEPASVVGPPTAAGEQPATAAATGTTTQPQVDEAELRRRQEHERQLQARYNAMAKQYDLLMRRWPGDNGRGELATQRVQIPEERAAVPAVGAVSSEPTLLTAGSAPSMPDLRMGQVFLGVTTSLANTDDAMPLVRARILSGPAKGAELMGTLEASSRGGGGTLRFTAMTPPGGGAAVPIEAIAVDPVTSRTSVATDVNRHTVSRMSALFFSSVLGGASEALMQGGRRENVITSGNNLVVQRDAFSDRELAMIGVGRMGQNGASMMESAINRPPTVTLKGGTEIGVLFLKDTSFR